VRILQLTSDWKWTGPAEPMLRLSEALRARGHVVSLACPEPPAGGDPTLLEQARKADLAPRFHPPRGRGIRPLADRRAIREARRYLAAERIDLVHTWHTRDHALALRAAGLRRSRRRARVIRSYRVAEAIPATPWNRWLFGPGSDGLLCISPGTARRNQGLRAGRALAGVFGAVDTERFRPAPADPALRHALGLLPEQRVVGIVARVQAHRRFDLLLAAAQRLFAEDPSARLLIVGRGTRREELAEEPARRMGIADRVIFAGYRREDYAAVLRAMDVFTFLVPGSDGSCRALLEAAACGIPAVTSRRGALPEIVADGRTGLLVDETPAALASAWAALLADDERRTRLGEAARRRAEQEFTPERLADQVLELYEAALR
jgi:glycosyltransferase involved in cell wall biosynthesis